VALARALASEPRLLLLDEPFSALDAERRPQIRALLQGLLGEFAGPRLLITHDPLEALLLGDRVVVLEQGRVTQSGSAETLRRAPRSRYVASLIGLNLVTGTLRIQADRMRLEFPGGALFLPRAELPDGTRALATIHPRAVVVAVTSQHSSARNRFEGRIEALDDEGERVRLRLSTTPALVAEVTPDAVHELGLRPGRRVFASVKATEIDVHRA
jgi:molybdate transport system ATP-binding protein